MEEQLFNKVKQNLPSHWDHMIYENKVYGVVKLSEYGGTRGEYAEITNFYNIYGDSSYKINKIYRIQNPFAYGAFMLRKEQLENRGYHPTVSRNLVKVDVNDAKEAITYNLDSRRINNFLLCTTNFCYVVKKEISANEDRDSNSFPEYIIYVTRR